MSLQIQTAEAEYDELVRILNLRWQDVQNQWVVVLHAARVRVTSVTYRAHRLRELQVAITEMRQQVEQATTSELARFWARDLQRLQAEYFQLKQAPLAETKEVTEARLRHEFRELLLNPFVRAVDAFPLSSVLVVYTSSFAYRPEPDLLIGPFRIELRMSERGKERWKVFRAHVNASKHPFGAGQPSGCHCFGNVTELLNKLLDEVRVCEALGVMFEAFQCGGTTFHLDGVD